MSESDVKKDEATKDEDMPSIAVQGHSVVIKQEHKGPPFVGQGVLVVTTRMTPKVARHLAKQLNLCADAAEEDA